MHCKYGEVAEVSNSHQEAWASEGTLPEFPLSESPEMLLQARVLEILQYTSA